ncbi:MAG: hypothetical protein K2M98_08270 [Muribaculum sp.]|nr:hypothetical protein [Muribaculum sp.]
MKKIADYLLVVVMLFALQSCSNDDEPKHVDPYRISGEWYITNIRGWQYDDDAHKHKSEFNKTYNFNGQGIPVGDNMIDALKVKFSVNRFDSENDFYYIGVSTYYWSLYGTEWKFNESGEVRLQGNQLINGTLKASITKLTDTTMTTYQKDDDGEPHITYTKLTY